MRMDTILIKRVGKAAILVCLIVAFMCISLTGCVGGETAQKGEPVTLEATATQAELQEKLSDESVSGVVLSGNISLTEPLQIAGSKSITGAGTISAGEGFNGDYLITVADKGELLLGGDVVVDAAGVAGGVHVASNAVLTLQDQAAVKNASAETANLLVEGFLDMLGGSLSGAKGNNIHNVGETNIVGGEIRGSGSGYAGIYNEGTLSQNGGVVTGGYNNIVSAEGSEFTWNGGSNESAVNNGLIVAPKAKLTVTARDAKLTGAGNLGIELQGTAVIDDITLNNSFTTLIKIASTGKLTLNGGMIFGASLHGVDNAGVMIMNGGDIMSCADCGIVNTGTLEVKGGGISDHGNKGILNKLEGKATVIGENVMLSGNRFAIGNEDKAYFELAKAYIMGSTTTNIYALGGEMYIHDIDLGASNSNNIRVVAADLKLKDVIVSGNASSGSTSMHGIILEGGSVHATDLTVRNTTGAGIRNKGGTFTGKNVTLTNNARIAIYTSDQDVTGRPATTVLENLTVSKQGYMSVSSNGTGVLEITNGVFEATPSNNIRVNGGTVKLNKVEVRGHTEAATTAHHGIYMEGGGHIIANNLTITDTKGHGLRSKGGNFTGTNVVIKNVGGDAGISNVRLDNGATGVITLTNVAFSNVKSKNIVCDAGIIRINNSTLSASPGSNIKITGGTVALDNVNVMGNQKVGTDALHAIIIEKGKGTLTAKNTTISGAKNSGIRNKTGVVEATNLTIKDCGSSAISNGEDATLGLKGITKINGLTVKDCGNNNIVADAGEVHITDAKLGPTESNNVKTTGNGLLTLTDVVVNGSTGSYGVIAEGGSIKLKNVTIKDTKTAGIRVNKANGSVTGENVTIENTGTHAIYVNHGSVEIKNLTTKNIGARNIEVGSNAEVKDGKKIAATGGTVKIVGGTLCKTEKQHSVVSYGEKAGTLVELTNVTLNGSGDGGGSRHVILAEGGNVKLTDVTIKDANNAAVRVNKSASTVEAENLTIQGGNWGISASAGKVTVKNLKATAKNRNIAAEGATIVVEDAELGATKNHNIKINKGSLTLKNATIAGSSDRGIMVEPGEKDGQPKVDLTNITISNTKSYALDNMGGIVTVKNLTTSNVDRSINNASGTTTVVGGTFGITPSHNVKAGSGSVSLTDVTIEGTKTNYGIIAEGGDVVLNKVTIKNASVAGIRINKSASSVEGTDVVIEGGSYGISGSKGTVVINNLTSSATVHNILGEGAKITVNGGTLNATGAKKESDPHNVKAIAGKVTLKNVTVNGVTDDAAHALMAEGGDMALTDVTVKGAKNVALRVNVADSDVTAKNLTIQDSYNGIYVSAGKVTITNLSGNASRRNIEIDGGSLAVTGGTLATTTAHNAKVLAGSLSLKQVDILGSSDRGVMIEPDGANPTVELVDVKISNTKSYALDNMGGTVTVKNLTTDNCDRSVNNVSGTVTVDGGNFGVTPGHNVKAGSGKVTLSNVTINGTTKNHGIMAEGGDIVLNNVTIKNASNAGIRINKSASSVEGDKVIIEGGVYGISGSAGTVTVSNLTVTASVHTILAEGAAITVNGGTLNATGAKKDATPHNVKALSGSVSLSNVTLNGVTDSSAHVLMAEGGDMTLTNVTVKGAKNAALRVNKAASEVTATKLTIEDSANGVNVSNGVVTVTTLNSSASNRNLEVSGGTVTVNGGELDTTSTHNIKVYDGKLVLNDLTVKGSSGRGIMIEPEADHGQPVVELTNVTINNTASHALENKGGAVTATNLTITGAKGGAVQNNTRKDGTASGTITVNGGTFTNISGHGVKSSSGKIILNTVTIDGTLNGSYGVLCEGGTIEAATLTVKNTTGAALRTNRDSSSMTVNGLTVVNCVNAIKSSAGVLSVDDMTANTSGATIIAEGAAITVKNATSLTTTANVVEHTGGTLNLENVTAATIYNTAADLNLSGKIVGSITNDAAVAVNVTGALSADSSITIDWTAGNGPTGTAIDFTSGTMAADQSKFTLGPVQSEIKKLVFENNTGRLENLYNYVAQVGDTKYEDLNEAIAALIQLTGDQTLIILADCGDENTTIEVPDGMNLTIQGGDYLARLGATVKVGANDTLIIGKNVTFGNVEVVIDGVPYEEVITLAEGHSVKAEMFSLKTSSGVAYGAMIENNKVMVYTKDAADNDTLQAAVSGAPVNAKGFIMLKKDIGLTSGITIKNSIDLIVLNFDNDCRIYRDSENAFTLITVEDGGRLTVTGQKHIQLDADSMKKDVVVVNGGDLLMNNVEIKNAGTDSGSLIKFNGGSVSAISATLTGGRHAIRMENVTEADVVSLNNAVISDSFSNMLAVYSGTLNLNGTTTLTNAGNKDDGTNYHALLVSGGTVNATGTVTITSPKTSGIRVTGGSVTCETVNISSPGSHAIWTEGGTLTITKGGTIQSASRSIHVVKGTVSVTGMTFKNTTTHSVKMEKGNLTLTNVTMEGSNAYGIILEGSGNTPQLTLDNVTIQNTKRAGIRMTTGGTVTGTDVTFTNVGNSDSSNRSAISVTNGTVNLDGVTASGSMENLDVSGSANVTLNDATMSSSSVNVNVTGGTATITNSTLTTTGTGNVVEHKGGTLNLENVTAATVYNTAANLNLSGKIVGSITNDAAVAVNVTSALTDGSAVTIDWTEGNAPADTAISFVDGTMDASVNYITLGTIQGQINNLVFADNAGKLVSKVFVAQVGAKKYEIFADAVAAITAENNTLTLLESCSATGTIVVPEGVSLTVQGDDEVVTLNATVQVGEGESLTIGENVKIAKVDATAGGSITYAGNAATAAEPMTVVVKGQAHEVALTLADGITATADMFTLVDAAGNAYGAMIEDGKVKVYTKDVNTQEAMQAAVDAAPDNARGYIVITGDVTINSTVNFTANKILTMQDDGNARKILRGDTTGKMLQVDAGAKLTIRSTSASEKLTFDGGKLESKKGSGMINTQGELNMTYVGIVNNQWDANNRGLGLYANAGSVVTMDHVRFDNINNTYAAKAVAFIVNGATVKMTNSSVTNCTAKSSGVIEVTNGSLTATNCTFSNNTATYGGAIYVANNANSRLTVDGCLFENNHATGNAGAIQVDFSNVDVYAVTIKNSTFRNNSADSEGGAISAATGGHLNISDTIFEGNKANRAATNVAQNYGNDIRLGGASNVVKISGKMQVEIFNHNAATLYVVGNLTAGSNVVIDGRTDKYTPNPAISFASGVMATSQNYISLGASQTAANKYLQFADDKAVLVDIPVVTTQAELEQALANAANIPVIKIAANTTVSLENVAFPTTAVTIQGQTGSVLKYGGSTKDGVMMNFPEGSNVTFQGVTLDGNAVGKLLIPAGANVTLANSTVTNMKSVSNRSVDVCGNLNLRGTVTIDGANWALGVQGSGKVTSEASSKLIIKNSTYGVTTHGTADVHIVEIETTNVSNSALYNDNSAVMVVDNANLGASASGKNTVNVLNGTVTLSNATITNPGGYAVIQTNGSLTMNTVVVQNAPGWSVCLNGASAVMNATNLTISGSKGTCLQIQEGTAIFNNFTTTNVVSSHNIKVVSGSLTINGMNLGKSNSNSINMNGTSTLILEGTCVINGTVTNNGIVLNDSSSVQISGDFTTTDCAGNGINAQAGTVKLAGKVNTDINYTAAVSLNVTGALTAGSNVKVDWTAGKAPAAGATAIKFASADVLNASKGFITLGATQAATQELTFGETTATLTAKQ